MTVSVVGTDSGSGFTDAVPLTVPVGAVADDLVLIGVSSSRFPGLQTDPVLTTVGTALSGTNVSEESRLRVFQGVVGIDVSAGQTINVGVPGGGSNNYSGTLICLHSSVGDALELSPAVFDDGVTSLADPGDVTPTAPSIPLTNDGVLIFLGSTAADAGLVWTAPATYTDAEETDRLLSQQQLAYKTVASGGSSGIAEGALVAAEPWNAVHMLVYEIAPDVTPPTCAIDQVHGTGPVDDIYRSAGYDGASDVLTVTGTATDETSLNRVEVGVDGGAQTEAVGTGTWSFDIDVSGWTAGTHTIEAIAYDEANNPSTEAQVTVWHSPNGLYGAASTPGEHLMPLIVQGA